MRAVILGLLGAVVVCGFTYFNDAVIYQTLLVGNHMPFSVYGALIFFLLFVRPLLERTWKRFALSGSELAVILTLVLASCCIPSSGLLRTLTPTLILPHQYEKTTPGWKNQQIVSLTPERMLVDISKDESTVLNGFVQGLGEGSRHISPARVPWYAWIRTMGFWLPLAFTLWIAMIAMALIVHKQWLHHENLPYPIAGFTKSLFPPETGGRSSLFESYPFWIGLSLVFLINMNNYLCQWFPTQLIPVRLQFDLGSLTQLFPMFQRGGGLDLMSWCCRFYFTVIGVAFFLAADVSFSIGISPFVYCLVAGFFAGYGVPLVAGNFLHPMPIRFICFGAYLGFFLTVLYTGRNHYARVFRGMLKFHPVDSEHSTAVWGARILVISLAAFAMQLFFVGLDLPLAIVYTAATAIFFFIMGRVIAETGLFFFQPFWCPCVIILGVFGPKALGPQSVLIMSLLCTVFMIDPREVLIPYMVNSFGLLDQLKVKLGKAAIWSVVSLLIGLTVAVPVTLYFQYDRGMNSKDQWATAWVPRFAFDEAVWVKQRLDAQDSLQASESLRGLARLAEMAPDRAMILWGLGGLAAVLALSACRLRFPRWPLHPLLFLVWYSYAGRVLAWSFLLGWFLKVMTTKYGGASGYQKVKPFMIGIIAGDMLGCFVPFLAGLIYYFVTGEVPPAFSILPV